jgi:hypothetical protein
MRKTVMDKKRKKRKTGPVKKTAACRPRRAAGKGLIGDGTRVRKHPNVASRTIDGQEVVIVPSSRKLQILNDVATAIWSLCDGRSVKEIVEAIMSEYDVCRARATKDVKDFVAQIHKRGMIELL